MRVNILSYANANNRMSVAQRAMSIEEWEYLAQRVGFLLIQVCAITR